MEWSLIIIKTQIMFRSNNYNLGLAIAVIYFCLELYDFALERGKSL